MDISRLPELEQISAPDATASSCFHKLEVSEHISLLPCFVGRLSQGILEHLDKKLLRYSEQYSGVLLAYSKPSVQQTHGRILDEQPHIHFDLKYMAYVFRPVIDSIVCGTVNNVGGDHVGCLVYDCFNASVFARQLSKGRQRLNGLFSEFVVGSKIWFRVVSIENISGILSIVGEYFDISSLSQEEPICATNDNEIEATLLKVDSSLELIAGSSENDEPTINSGRSPKKKKHKEKRSKKKRRLAEFESEGGEEEREIERIVKIPKKHKRKSKMSEDNSAQTVEEPDNSVAHGEKLKKKKKSKKRKRSEDSSSSETPKAKKLKVTDDSTTLPSKKHKHKR